MQILNKGKRGYTLIEILVVISIVGFVLSTALYLVTSAREKGRIAGILQFSDGVRASLSGSPFAYWSFDNGDATDGWGQNHGSLPGNPDCTVEGVVGGACYFDGNGEWMNPPSPNPGFFHDAFTGKTFEAWFNTVDTSVRQTIYDEGGSANGYWVGINSNQVQFWTISGSSSFNIISSSVKNNFWHHVVAVFDNNELKLYLDGKKVGTNTAGYSTVAAHSSGPGIGATAGGDASGFSGNAYFQGFIDEVKIYSEALPFAQIQKLYAEGAEKHELAVK